MKLGTGSKIAISWAIITAAGLFGFYLSKRSINNSRYELMQIRERIKNANEGDYELPKKSTRF